LSNDQTFAPTEFGKMKEDVILVNTSRGAVIHEDAMVDALNSGKGTQSHGAIHFPLQHIDLISPAMQS
jgi:hypothetical protein